ncbi:MAG: ImmA/IrrE family metallo-endopeptidase [Thermoleophilaceae bacterium]|nr:ImmA/IrrE family metallo-endopeptidase [Thermoleophilaceae bacterium]
MGRGRQALPGRARGGGALNETIARAFRAEAVAERELERVPDWLWDGQELPVPVEAIADSHYGLLVREGEDLAQLAGIESGGTVSGLLLPGAREIWVDAEEAERVPARRRFTIGHELGHWVLDCRQGVGRSAGLVHCRSAQVREGMDAGADAHAAALEEYPPAELDANQFAAALLMPRELVLREHERLRGDERALCATFRVSRLALQRRLWFLSIPR